MRGGDERIDLLSNASATSSYFPVRVGGTYLWSCEGTFNGGSYQLQLQNANGTATDIPGATMSAAGFLMVDLPPGGLVRAVESGTTTVMYSTLVLMPFALGAGYGGHIGSIGGTQVFKTATPAVTAGAYTTGQCVGALNSLAGASRVALGSGIIKSCMVTVKTALTAPYDVIFFSTNPSNSTFTDNASLAINVADLQSICGISHCNEVVSGGTPQILQAPDGLAIPFKLAAATTLYAQIVIRGGQTYASTSAIGLQVGILQD